MGSSNSDSKSAPVVLVEPIPFTLRRLMSAVEAHADAGLRDRYGISIGDFTYLATLSTIEPTDITGLAQCLVVSKAAVSKRIPLLELAGWVTRETDPAHAKRIILRLTSVGKSIVAEAGAELETEFHALFADPRVDTGIEPAQLQRHLAILSELVSERSHS